MPFPAFLKLTTVFIIFWDLQISYQIFLSQKAKQNVIITNNNVKGELADMLLNDVTLEKI